jgi:hypothetical protein
MVRRYLLWLGCSLWAPHHASAWPRHARSVPSAASRVCNCSRAAAVGRRAAARPPGAL